MISLKNIPVLIDFGFAERYDATAKDAFISNLHYGTPEVCIINPSTRCLYLLGDSTLHQSVRAVYLMIHERRTFGLSV
jgi:hypothetical protein